MIAKSRQLANPKRFHFSQPAAKLVKRLFSQLVDPHAGIFLNAFFPDQAASSKHPQMTAERGRSKFKRGRNLACTERTVFKKVDHGPAVRISECG